MLLCKRGQEAVTRWVVDCSFAAALFLPDKRSHVVHSFFEELAEPFQIWVPALWWYEFSNVLVTATRTKTIGGADLQRIISLFGGLPIETEALFPQALTLGIHGLAMEYGLSGYDAAYLDLALRLQSPLATLDRQLHRASGRCGVVTYPPLGLL
jgi:predicted nucleic acid-binding protein